MAATGFLFILRGRLRGIGAGTRPIFSQLMSRAVHWETYAYCYLPRAGCVFLARNYTPRGSKGEIDLIGYDDKRWHLRNSGRAPSGRTCRPDQALPGKNNMLLFARRNDFWRNVTSASVPAGLMKWQLTTARGSRRWYGCTRMHTALKYEEPVRKIFTRTPDGVQFKVSWLLTLRGCGPEHTQGGLFCRSCVRTRSPADG